jgi:hypothetical protein
MKIVIVTIAALIALTLCAWYTLSMLLTTPVHNAVVHGEYGRLQALLATKKGRSMAQRESFAGMPPQHKAMSALTLAAFLNDRASVEILLAAGLVLDDPDARHPLNAMDFAMHHNNDDLLIKLYKMGATPARRLPIERYCLDRQNPHIAEAIRDRDGWKDWVLTETDRRNLSTTFGGRAVLAVIESSPR